jgi:hypothetical protein
MSDNIQVTPGSGATVAADLCTVNGVAALVPLGKLGFGGNDAFTYITSTVGLPTSPAGNVASGSADSGNPIKVGGVYHAAPIALADGQRGDAQLDANGYLLVHVASGSTGNAAAGATGSAVPAQADFAGLNVAGDLRGQTGVNPSGAVYAAQTDLASVGGATFALGQQAAASSIPVVLTAAQLSALTPLSTVSISGTVPVSAAPIRGALTDRSGTITAGGTAQTLAAANAARSTFFFQNNSSGALWINFTATAVQSQPSIQVSAGSSFSMDGRFVSTEAISVIGATTAQAWTAKEG